MYHIHCACGPDSPSVYIYYVSETIPPDAHEVLSSPHTPNVSGLGHISGGQLHFLAELLVSMSALASSVFSFAPFI